MSDTPSSYPIPPHTEASLSEERSPIAKEYHVSFLRYAARLLYMLSPSERLFLYVCSILLGASALVLAVTLNQYVMVSVPSYGGTLHEGIVGTPRFVNPLLAISPVDQDLSTLVYSGLIRATPDGDLVPDLAESYTIENDGTTYTFHLRPDAVFHDGTPVTAEDVVFTVALAQHPDIKSPRRADWEGVFATSTDPRTVVFTLPNAYAPFLENAEMGILPKHLWEGVTPEEFQFHALNIKPVGSGPYEVTDVKTDTTGAPTRYTLKSFNRFTLGAPFISRITFRFFPNEEDLLLAFSQGHIDSFAGIAPDETLLEKRPDTHMIFADSTRVFGVFFNQNRSAVFTDARVREALNVAVSRDTLVKDVLGGHGSALITPIPTGLFATNISDQTAEEDRVEAARTILERGGWEFNEETGQWFKEEQLLAFALATADAPELVATAETLADMWRAVGIVVDVQVYPLAEFNPNVLRPRAYDAVLFGEVVGRTLDLFAFWHSSQRNDPGLNLALYANATVDRLLASARVETNARERNNLYHEFVDEIEADRPAVFLYTPKFVYVLPQHIGGVHLGVLTNASERFLDVQDWYTDTEEVWDFFATHNLF